MVKNLREQGETLLEEKRLKDEEAKKKSVLGFFSKSKQLVPNQNGQTPSSSPHSRIANVNRDKSKFGSSSGEGILARPKNSDDSDDEDEEDSEEEKSSS